MRQATAIRPRRREPGGCATSSPTCRGVVAEQGTPGADRFAGTEGPDSFDGLAGADEITGNSGIDHLCGGADGDLISGGSGNDTIDGGADGDLIDPGAGSDEVFAGDGPDLILALDGSADTIDCGDGRDLVAADPIDVLVDCEPAINSAGGNSARDRFGSPDGGDHVQPAPKPEGRFPHHRRRVCIQLE